MTKVYFICRPTLRLSTDPNILLAQSCLGYFTAFFQDLIVLIKHKKPLVNWATRTGFGNYKVFVGLS